jgi:hypothetical protein
MTDAEGIQRFVREAAKFDPELARWLAAAIWAGLSASRRRRVRDDLLREAAGLLPPVSVWQKARLLADLARRAGSRPGVSTAAGLVALATEVYCPERRDRELSRSQIFRVLVSRISTMEMEAGSLPEWDSMLEVVLEHEE